MPQEQPEQELSLWDQMFWEQEIQRNHTAPTKLSVAEQASQFGPLEKNTYPKILEEL